MQITVDISTILAVCLNESSKSSLIKATEEAVLLAANSLPWEIGNALSAAFKQNRLTLEAAQAAFAIYQKIPIKYKEIDISLAINISHRLRIYAYDAYILACALQFNTPLLTLDVRQAHAAKEIGISCLEVTP